MIRIRLNKVIGQYLEEELPDVVEATGIKSVGNEKQANKRVADGGVDTFLLDGDMDRLETLMNQLSYLDQDD